MTSIVILGGGGHARVVADTLMLRERSILGAVARKAVPGTNTAWGLPLLGDDDALDALDRRGIALANGVGSIGSTALRADVFRRARELGFAFTQVIHPSAVIAASVELGDGAQIMAGAVVQPGTEIGDNVLINTRASVDHDCRIGAHVHIAPGAVLSGGVKVGEGTHIGTGAVIIQSLSIGKHCLIAAGAVVCRDVPDGAVVRAPESRNEIERGA